MEKTRASEWGWGCAAPIKGSCSEATDLQSDLTWRKSHVDFWVKNLGRGNCKSSEVGQGAIKGPVRLEGARGRVGGDEGKEVLGRVCRALWRT